MLNKLKKRKHINPRGSVTDRVTHRDRIHGAALIRMVLLIPITLVVLLALVVAFYEGRKVYWDHRVQEMCEKDGGVAIFESVTIDRAQFKKWGGIGDALGIPNESERRLDIPYYRRTKDDVLRAWNPRVMRLETEYIRRRDNKILGKTVYYFRRGGDFPTWAHESTFGCNRTDVPIEKSIVVIKG